MRWTAPVLEIDVLSDQDRYLGGRGLLLIPSYMSMGTPDYLRDHTLPEVLVRVGKAVLHTITPLGRAMLEPALAVTVQLTFHSRVNGVVRPGAANQDGRVTTD